MTGSLGQAVICRGGGSNRGLDGGNSDIGTGRGVLGGLVESGGNSLVGFAELSFNDLGDFFLRLGGDFIDAARVSDGLFNARLRQGRLQSNQFLNILGAKQSLGRIDAIFENSASGIQVQGGEALCTGKSGVGQGQQGFDSGLVVGGELSPDLKSRFTHSGFRALCFT